MRRRRLPLGACEPVLKSGVGAFAGTPVCCRVGHSILTATWHMLQSGELYNDLGADYFIHQNPDRITKRLVRQLEALGHTVTLEAREVAA